MPYLFSYGTLQQEEVQLSAFRRKLSGTPDSLVGFVITEMQIEDAAVVVTSGKEFHPIAKLTGLVNHRVLGTVFEVTEDELKQADHYEVDAYKRVSTTLESGKTAWVYVEALSLST